MAKEGYTNITALQAVLDGTAVTDDDALKTKIQAMLTSEQNKREAQKKRPKVATKEQRENLALAKQMVKAIVDNGNEPVGTDWISERVQYLDTPNKVAGKAKIARANGWIENGAPNKKKVTYIATDAGIAMVAEMAD